MYNLMVEWLDEDKSRARFALPGRQEWTAQNVTDLIGVLAQIREQMAPAPAHEAPLALDHHYVTELHIAWQRSRQI